MRKTWEAAVKLSPTPPALSDRSMTVGLSAAELWNSSITRVLLFWFMVPSRRTKRKPCSLVKTRENNNVRNSELSLGQLKDLLLCWCTANLKQPEPLRMYLLPQWSLQYGEEACKLRDNQTLDAAVVTSQPEQVPHQWLHLRRQKQTLKEEWHNSHKVAYRPTFHHSYAAEDFFLSDCGQELKREAQKHWNQSIK